MTSEESKNIMDKLQTLMTAAEDFSSQSKQLAAARGNFDEYLKAVVETDKKMTALISQCENYIKETRQIVNKDLSEKIDNLINGAASAVQALQNQIENNEKELEKLKGDLGNTISDFNSSRTKLLEAVEEFQKITNSAVIDINKNTDSRTEKVQSDLNKSISRTKEALMNTLSAQNDQIKKSNKQINDELTARSEKLIEALHEDISKQSDVLLESEKNSNDKILQKIEGALANIDQLNLQQKKNDLLIKIAIGIAGLSAVLSLINLFVR